MTDSQWAPTHTKDKLEIAEGQLVFDTRDKCVEYLDSLLRYKMFHRAKKIPVAEKEKKEKKGKKKDEIVETNDDKTDTDMEKGSETGEEEKVEKAEKKKRKIRLDMHLEQIFVDSSDAYVWLYDPIPWYYWILGGGICLIVIMFCLMPNLTKDVGFINSFWPLYDYTYTGEVVVEEEVQEQEEAKLVHHEDSDSA